MSLGGSKKSVRVLSRMLKGVLILIAACASAYAGIKDCGQNPLFTITELSQVPSDSVSGGQNVSLALKYSSPEEISAGSVTKSITLNYIPFAPTTEDLCVNAPCPISAGDHDGSSWSIFPSGVAGLLVSKVTWKDQTGRELLCVQSNLKASSKLRGMSKALIALEQNF